MRSVLTARIRADAFASSRQRLDLGSIFGAKHQSSRTPPVERHGTPRNRPTRTGRQQQGRAPNQDKRRLGARPAAAAVAGPGDEGATLYWLVLVNERMRWLGWGVLMLACRWGWVLDVHGALAVGWSRYASAPHRRGCVREGRWFGMRCLAPWFSSGNSG